MQRKVRNPDMLIGAKEGEEIVYPDFYKKFFLGNTKNEIVDHDCYYEGPEMFNKLKDHVILGQLTVDKDFSKYPNDSDRNFEHTPFVETVSPLFPHNPLMGCDKLWRYISYEKFENLISSKSLYFARIDQFKDNLEGVPSFISVKNILADKSKNDKQKQEILRLYHLRAENNRKVSYACCWHINNNVNKELWNIYGEKSSESIGIETNVAKLSKELSKTGMAFLNEPVRYFDENYFNQYVYWFPTMFKRLEYKSENEYRTILFVHGWNLPGVKAGINIENLIRRIHIHPDASKEFFKKVQIFIKESRFKIPVTKSR
jgi:hypothetical protein